MSTNNFGEFYDQRAEQGHFDLCQSEKTPFPRFAIAPYQFIWDFFEKLSSTSRVLDIGCGCGVHSVYFAQRANFVHGIDISQKSLDIAIAKVKKLNFEENCLFEKKDFLSLSKPEIDYDLLFASGVLYYFNISQVKDKILTLLKPGGTFCAIETVGDNHLINLYRRITNFLYKYRDEQTMKNLLKIDDFEALASNFASYKIYYFDFLTLFLRPVQNVPILGNSLLSVAREIDYFLLNKLGFKKLSFKMVLIASK